MRISAHDIHVVAQRLAVLTHRTELSAASYADHAASDAHVKEVSEDKQAQVETLQVATRLLERLAQVVGLLEAGTASMIPSWQLAVIVFGEDAQHGRR